MDPTPPPGDLMEPLPTAVPTTPPEGIPQSSPSAAPDAAHPPPSSIPLSLSPALPTSQIPPQPSSQPQAQSLPPPQPPSQLQQPIQQQPRPSVVRNRPQTAFPHFGQHITSSAPPSSSVATTSASSPSPSAPAPASQRGGLAIGVPAMPRAQQSPVTPYSTFSASPAFSQSFSALPRMAEQSLTANAQVRQPIQGIQNIGMIGSLSTSSQIRPGGATGSPQQRFSQPTSRAPSPSATQSLGSHKFPTSALMRGASIVASTSMSSLSQQPLASSQGKQMPAPSTSSSSFRPQVKPHVLQQRPQHTQQSQQPVSAVPQQQQTPTSQQPQQQNLQQKQHQQVPQKPQPQQQFHQLHASSRQPQEQYNQQNLQLKNQQFHQLHASSQHPTRPLGPTTTKPSLTTLNQTNAVQPGATTPHIGADVAESGNQILSKRSIHELVSQIDPSEKLDSDVEDVLVEVAEDFIESVTTFACSLAKHRKSTTLEAKDILLHVERNWNMSLPGFGGDEIKTYKKQFTNDIHKERLAVIKKAMGATGDAANTKNVPGGQSAASSKAHAPKVPTIGSPKA